MVYAFFDSLFHHGRDNMRHWSRAALLLAAAVIIPACGSRSHGGGGGGASPFTISQSGGGSATGDAATGTITGGNGGDLAVFSRGSIAVGVGAAPTPPVLPPHPTFGNHPTTADIL